MIDKPPELTEAEFDRRLEIYGPSAARRWDMLHQWPTVNLDPDEFIDRLIDTFDAVEITPLGGLFT